jgi:hypothetical protein
MTKGGKKILRRTLPDFATGCHSLPEYAGIRFDAKLTFSTRAYNSPRELKDPSRPGNGSSGHRDQGTHSFSKMATRGHFQRAALS